MDSLILLLITLLSSVAKMNAQKNSTLSAIETAILNEEEVRCHNFSIGNTQLQEFYSPNYPGKYPPKTDCILTIKAEIGYIIRVDFRDQFHLEPNANCEYDFLEIRDGAHGYSALKSRFCGHSFPAVVTSSGPFLWLRFNSDDNVEYEGFRAVYQFIPDIGHKKPDAGTCRFELSGLDGTFSSKDIPESTLEKFVTSNSSVDCTWVITVREDKKIQLSFPQYSLVAPNECHMNFIEIFGDKTDLKHRLRQFCGSAVDNVISKTNVVHVRFYAQLSVNKSSFEAIFTSITPYKDPEAAVKCQEDEFDCEDAICIDSSLKCNGRINCKFRHDEDKCNVVKKNIFFSHHIIIILSLGCIIMFGMCFNCFYKCFRKLRADHTVYQARRSRSREDRLDDIRDMGHGTAHTLKMMGQSVQSRSLMQRINMEDADDGGFQRPRLATATTLQSTTTVDQNIQPHVRPENPTHQVSKPGNYQSNGIGPSADSYEEGSDDDDEDEEPVEMVDHACQTRESLFSNQSQSGSEKSKPQVLPKPAILQTAPTIPPHQRMIGRTGLPPSGHLDQRNPFRAERLIDIRKQPGVAPLIRPTTTASSSVASSKSGPDVLVLH